jgi:putative ABC transport system substrate-binding protein
MKKRIVLLLSILVLATLILGWVNLAEAQQAGKVYRIGVLITASPGFWSEPFLDGFRQGLRELGYVEGKNVVLEIRYGESKRDRVANLAAELVRLKVDVIVAGGGLAINAAKKATRVIPIVMRTGRDPVRSGYVDSLAHPGENITGMISFNVELNSKRLELLVEAVPGVKRIAVLTSSRRFAAREGRGYKKMQAAAQALGVKLQVLRARDANTIDSAFLAMSKERAEALNIRASAHLLRHMDRIQDLASKNRLPSIFFHSTYVERGGLMSYGPSLRDEWRRTARIVDKILKGANPANLPVEQTKKFELIINLKTAKRIGLTIPPEVLLQATKVIK